MPHAVTVPPKPFLAMDGALRVHIVPDASDNLVWIAECVETGAAAVVDGPGCDVVLAYAAEHGIRIDAIFNTHTHGDHIGVNLMLKKRGELGDYRVVGRGDQVPGLTEHVGEGDTVTLGAVTGRVMLTEGHINDHITFVFGDVAFCGDTMFAGGCGYLFDGPASKMHDSLMRLAALAPETRVCCAHEYTKDNLRFAWFVEPDNEALAERIRDVWARRALGECTVPSTLAIERATNPFLRPGSVTLRANVEDKGGRELGGFGDVFAATRELKNTGAHKAIPDSALPLQVAGS